MSSPPNRSSKSSNPVPPRQAAKQAAAKIQPSEPESISTDTPAVPTKTDSEGTAGKSVEEGTAMQEALAENISIASSVSSTDPQPESLPTHVTPSQATHAVASEETDITTSNLELDNGPNQELDEGFNLRQQPIPPPSESRQYRAIGLIRGRYAPSPEQFTRGVLVASDGTEVNAVLLGRVMSLVKKHINLEEEHLWVVYPRTREREFQLHAQIVGVWEPEKLHRQLPSTSDSSESHSSEAESSSARTASGSVDSSTSSSSPTGVNFPPLEDGYFSIRGEVIFQAEESGHVTVKIRQTPKKQEEDEKSFKLQLKGTLPGKAVGYFWDLTVQRQETTLVIQSSESIGIMPPRKKPPRSKSGPYRKPGGAPGGPKRNWQSQRPTPAGSSSRQQPPSTPPSPPVRKDPLPKPVKRKNSTGNNPA